MIIRVHTNQGAVFNNILATNNITNAVTLISTGTAQNYCTYINQNVSVYIVHAPNTQNIILTAISRLPSYKLLSGNNTAGGEHFI